MISRATFNSVEKNEKEIWSFGVLKEIHLTQFRLNLLLLAKWGHFRRRIFKCTFMNEKSCILIQDPLNFVSKGPIDNNPGLVQIIASRRIGDKSLSEQMLTRFIDTYMCTRGDELNRNGHHHGHSSVSSGHIGQHFNRLVQRLNSTILLRKLTRDSLNAHWFTMSVQLISGQLPCKRGHGALAMYLMDL